MEGQDYGTNAFTSLRERFVFQSAGCKREHRVWCTQKKKGRRKGEKKGREQEFSKGIGYNLLPSFSLFHKQQPLSPPHTHFSLQLSPLASRRRRTKGGKSLGLARYPPLLMFEAFLRGEIHPLMKLIISHQANYKVKKYKVTNLCK